MSAASVRTSGRRDNLPVFPIEAGNKGEPGSFSKPLAFKVLIEEFFELVMHGQLFLFAALFFEPEQEPQTSTTLYLQEPPTPGSLRVEN
jgi:hypothetical protein